MKLLYILNVANRVNNFSYASMIAAKEYGLEFHIAGNWGYETAEELKQDELKYGIFIHQIDFNRNPLSLKNYTAYRQLDELIKKWDFDFIHCNTPIGGILGRLVGKKRKVKKVIYQAHGFHFYKGAPKLNWLLYYPVEKWLAHYTDALITINQEDYELAKTKMHLRKGGKVYYVPGVGIDLDTYSSVSVDKADKRKELGLGDDDFVIISVGELNKNKNNEVIIDAIAKINNPKIHYILCGVGELEQMLKSSAAEKGIADKIHFLGYRTDVNELLKISDCFVMPSFREGLSRSVMEAMVIGLPCVVSDIRGNTDLIEDGVNGFRFKPDDASGFAEGINKIVSDGNLKTAMGQNNLEKIKDFDIAVVENEMTKIYEEVFK